MLEKIKEDDAVPEFVQASKLVVPEYVELLANLSLYGKLFSLKYRERVTDVREFQRVLGVVDASVLAVYERKLDAYLRVVMGGEVRLDKVDLVCPECLKLNIVRYDCRGEEIKPCCSECGVELDESFADIESFDQSLDRDVTYAPTSHLSYTKGLGGSFDPNRDKKQNNFLWQILNARNVLASDFKAESPSTYEELEAKWLVEKADYIFCIVDKFIRKIRCEDFDEIITSYFMSENNFVPVEVFYRNDPELFNVLSNGAWFVESADDVYCLIDDKVYCSNFQLFYAHIMQHFHAFDVPLKNKKIRLEIAVKSRSKSALSYGSKLCHDYGFDMKNRDHTLLDTVGHEIELMKSLVKNQPSLRIPEKRLVETVFYICLLKCGKQNAAFRAKHELSVDLPLVNFYFDFADFRKAHERLSFSGVRLDALEQLVSKEP